MTVNAIESGTGDVWQVKQTVQGTVQAPTDANTKHLKKVGDDALKAAVAHGSEESVDGLTFGSPGVFVDTIGGDCGTITAQAQIETTGFAFAQMLAVDVVTGTTPDYTHTIVSNNNAQPYNTFRQKVGNAVGPWRNSFFDSKIGKLTFNCGQDQKVAHIAQNVFSLAAGNWFTADPSAADSGTDPFNWNEVAGSLKIGSTVFNELDGDTLEIDRKLAVHRGDSAVATCFLPGKGEINRSFSGLVSDNLIPEIQNALYGTGTMTDGLAVAKTVQYRLLESTYTRTSVRSLKITTPKVQMKPDDFEIGPRAEGGKIPITFGGMCFLSGGTHITVVAKTGDATAYV